MMSKEAIPSLSGLQVHPSHSFEGRPSAKVDFSYFPFVMKAYGHLQRLNSPSDLEGICENQPVSLRREVLAREDYSKPAIPPKPPGLRLHRKKTQLSSAAIQEPSSLCSRCDPSSSLPLWSCAKITRSKGKQGRALNGSTKALKKRLDSISIHPETIHGHPPQRYVADY